ncbi:altronate dehydratase [Paenalkalicoccus suaedae]|uniref:Altronate dehydratase n=1 Tax=Paenalkalicoccus suaedae TaxID=2592382 RepID=A0A859FJX6_9BACI|nr:altronate dehydratase [Paenalkalicoccus suaedae]
MDYIQVNEADHVFITLREYKKGDQIEGREVSLKVEADTPSGHKIARKDITKGESVYKFGYPIGHATKEIKAGQWVHTHNLKTSLSGTQNYDYVPKPQASLPDRQGYTFEGYNRKDGQAGIRNEVWVINTVGCINKTCETVVKMANETFSEEDGIDGVYHFPHLFGCSQLGDDLHNTQKILSGLIHHPNAAAILVMGLGCENNYIQVFKDVIGEIDQERIAFLEVQKVEDEIEEALNAIEELVAYASTFQKEPIPLSKLKVGLKCGGSDGLSGITANPLLGAFSDRLIAEGGTTVLTETPELFGAEHLLMERADNEGVFNNIVTMVNDFKEYFLRHGQQIYENPSPGNKDGGITTLEEKSLGNVQKGGFAQVSDVLKYGDRLVAPGLNLLEGPGNDLISVTALAASGAQIVLFTTGRGTPFGGPVPTVKLSTNTALAARKKRWIDFNAGVLVEGTDKEDLAEEFMRYIIDLASGKTKTNNERYGFKEISIFKDGVVL